MTNLEKQNRRSFQRIDSYSADKRKLEYRRFALEWLHGLTQVIAREWNKPVWVYSETPNDAVIPSLDIRKVLRPFLLRSEQIIGNSLKVIASDELCMHVDTEVIKKLLEYDTLTSSSPDLTKAGNGDLLVPSLQESQVNRNFAMRAITGVFNIDKFGRENGVSREDAVKMMTGLILIVTRQKTKTEVFKDLEEAGIHYDQLIYFLGSFVAAASWLKVEAYQTTLDVVDDLWANVMNWIISDVSGLPLIAGSYAELQSMLDKYGSMFKDA